MSDEPTPDLADVLARRLAFLRITKADAVAVRGASQLLTSRVVEVIDDLYVHLQAGGHVDDLLLNDERIARLKQAQLSYYEQTNSGKWDQDYLAYRMHIGGVHAKVGLDPEFYLGTSAYIFLEQISAVLSAYRDDPTMAEQVLTALTKIVFFDAAATIDTYIESRAQQMVEKFLGKLDGYLERLESTSNNLDGATGSQSESLQRQASAVAEITTAMAQLAQTAKQALGQAESVMHTTEHTVDVAQAGKQAVAEVSSGMGDIRSQMETLSERILLLNEQTQQIGDIISSVSEISEQSKLLALNAAIEAARAGEHGRGFAVVATEIRNLADQSKQSTQQVRSILGDIQNATDAAVLATEQGTLAVETGSKLADVAGERFNELALAVEESGESAKLIAEVSRQQGMGIDQISAAMEQINSNSEESARGMATIEAGSQSLAAIASDMQEVMEEFAPGDKPSPVSSGNAPTDPEPVA